MKNAPPTPQAILERADELLEESRQLTERQRAVLDELDELIAAIERVLAVDVVH